LKDFIAEAGQPIIVLQHYSSNFSQGGHFRVVVGYDDAEDVVILHDPWDRDGQPRLIKFNSSEFCLLWNYTETNIQPAQSYHQWVNYSLPPYPAVWISPWKVDVIALLNSAGNLDINATIEYQCFLPFCNPSQPRSNPYIANDTTVTLTLPSTLRL